LGVGVVYPPPPPPVARTDSTTDEPQSLAVPLRIFGAGPTANTTLTGLVQLPATTTWVRELCFFGVAAVGCGRLPLKDQ
jgi:hypothetical protein